uniref:Secretoglobin family 1C member 1 n=1 Tax=Strix occidentalis caurina TaxID=311401 RepID=A0A8D0FP81_STROC
ACKAANTVKGLFAGLHSVPHTAGAGSAHDVVPSFLLTLLEGSAEQVYAGLISQYNVDDVTGAALGALKECIDELSPAHVKALVDLLVTHSFSADTSP